MVRAAIEPPELALAFGLAFAFAFIREAAELVFAFGFGDDATDPVGAPEAETVGNAAPGSATAATDECVLNESSAASPAAVLPRVKMARRMKPPGGAGRTG
jgi:hypothetical protein